MIPCLFDTRQHCVLDDEILRWCKRQLPHNKVERDRLFFYHHEIHGTYVIARWASKELGIFMDFLNIGTDKRMFTRAKAMEFRRRLFAPTSAKTISDAFTQSERDYASQRQDWSAGFEETAMKRGAS